MYSVEFDDKRRVVWNFFSGEFGAEALRVLGVTALDLRPMDVAALPAARRPDVSGL